eukprot:Rhum_TRINITY_DN25465_c0_g1::Rhum_TRINITY_DN25465_c0_g1_i1::g.182117::m.182117
MSTPDDAAADASADPPLSSAEPDEGAAAQETEQARDEAVADEEEGCSQPPPRPSDVEDASATKIQALYRGNRARADVQGRKEGAPAAAAAPEGGEEEAAESDQHGEGAQL